MSLAPLNNLDRTRFRSVFFSPSSYIFFPPWSPLGANGRVVFSRKTSATNRARLFPEIYDRYTGSVASRYCLQFYTVEKEEEGGGRERDPSFLMPEMRSYVGRQL